MAKPIASTGRTDRESSIAGSPATLFPSMTLAQSRVLSYVLVFLTLFFGYLLLRGWAWQGSTQLHTVMETVAFMLALLVGALSMVRFYTKKNNTFLFIGTGFVGTGLLDGYHAIVTSTFFASNFPSAPSSLIPWSWIASRLFLSILLWLSWLAWRREDRLGEAGKIGEKDVYLITGLLTVGSFLFFAFVPLPRAYYPEIVFHRPEEFVPALFFLVALVGYLRKAQWQSDDFEHWLVLSLIVGFLGQVMFMSFSGKLFDMEFDAAHTLKKVSYICVLTGLLINIYHLFKKSEARQVQLEAEIAEKRQTEEKLGRSNAELEQFAFIATHDLQEPLRKMQSFGDLLASTSSEALNEQAQGYLQRMRDAAGRMRTLINDLLSFSRLSSQVQAYAPVDLRRLTREVLSDLEAQIAESGGRVEVEDLPTIDADPTQMRQLQQNLISNALKFHKPDEPPLVRVRGRIVNGYRANLSDKSTPEDTCEITVEDNGIGFDEKYLDRIFTVFQRLHGRDTYDGTGIGLATCRKIVERHGGSITAKSTPGEGATFIVTLPARQPEGGRENE